MMGRMCDHGTDAGTRTSLRLLHAPEPWELEKQRGNAQLYPNPNLLM
jgi:hypothetical protein